MSDGVVTPVGEGTATITLTATRGKTVKTATVKVKVVDPYKPTGVKLDKTGTAQLNLGETLTLTPTLSPETAQATYSWKSSSTKIAKVSDGVVTPVGEGTATITLTATRGKTVKSATVKVKVVDPYKPTGVKLDKTGTVRLTLDDTLTLTPTIAPETAQATYSWKSSSTKIARVVDGVITPVRAGTATITVTASRGNTKKTASVKVKVVDPCKLTGVEFLEKGTQIITVGSTLSLTANPIPIEAFSTTTWKSSADNIARVTDGVVTAVSVGTATITATKSRGGIKKSASIQVKVIDPTRLDGIKLRKSGTVILGLGKETEQAEFDLIPYLPDVLVRWESSNPGVATVDNSGWVVPVAYGTATITATAVQGDVRKSASFTVKVVDPENAYSIRILDGNGEPITKTKLGIPNETVFYAEVLPRCATQSCGLKWSVSNQRIRCNPYYSWDESCVKVSAWREGDAKLTVKASNGKQASITITAVKPK